MAHPTKNIYDFSRCPGVTVSNVSIAYPWKLYPKRLRQCGKYGNRSIKLFDFRVFSSRVHFVPSSVAELHNSLRSRILTRLGRAHGRRCGPVDSALQYATLPTVLATCRNI